MAYRYMSGAELPDLPLEWRDGDGDLIDFSSGYTFTVYVAPAESKAASFTKTTGITGAATSPNVVLAWPTTGAELNGLTAGVYDVQVKARRTSDSKDRWFPNQITIVIETPIA